ncbi:MAG: hypothetical protein GY780_11550, partial [bacterium]|nr:hypothetical protein [bacterium]
MRVFLIVVLCLFSAGFAIGQNILLEENFDDGIADDFENQCDNWEISPTGRYVSEDAGYEVFCWNFAGSIFWSDYSYTLDLKSRLSVNQLFAFRVQENGDCYVINLRSAPWNDVVLTKWNNGQQNHIFTTDIDNSNDTWHHLSVTVMGPQIEFFLNDESVFSYSDSYNPYLFGKIGVV